MDPLYSILTSQPSLDLKANGEVSRMRSHKGIPLRPQKLTFNTYAPSSLEPHISIATFVLIQMRDSIVAIYVRPSSRGAICLPGTNERVVMLLTRIVLDENLARLVQFFTKRVSCTSRGRECIFINDPEASRNKKLASSKRKLSLSASSSAGSSTSSTPSLYPESLTNSPTEFPAPFSPFSSTTPITPHSILPAMPALSISPRSSSTSSSHSSPRSEFFENQPDMLGTFDLNFDTYTLDTYLNRFSNTTLAEPFFDQSLSSCSAPQLGSINDFSWLESNEFYTSFGDEQFGFSQPYGYDEGFSNFAALTSTEAITDSSPRISAHQTSLDSLANSFYNTSSVVITHQGPTSADLDQYLSLFFSAFCKQVPVVHPATWDLDNKPLILLRAMQACGALFANTVTASAFVDETLASSRDTLIVEFAKATTNPRDQNHLILTVVLLQMMGMFHQKADQRISSSVYHGMLVMMIRRTGLIPRVGAWTPPDMNDTQKIDTAWREWVNYETIKRVLFLSYLHDCCHCMYFSLSPSFQPSELDMSLPCDDALWAASDAREWYGVVQTPSSYGSVTERLSGFPMKRALSVLGETRLSTVSLSLNPFSNFILIHTILRNLYASHAENPSPDPSVSRMMGIPEPAPSEEHENAFAIQYALHNWLQMWLNSPEAMQLEASHEEPPFFRNALPFYWLAQVSLLAVQDGSALFGGKPSDCKSEGRFRLMKEWLGHIRAFLRTGNQVPTHLWDELMNIRSRMSLEDTPATEDLQNGLLSFFPIH
ncbi:hypothetical protein H0H81_004752 [Sphagnurus paluster]|uniref:Xylanolytic transcriptional activator regulatory domain-containing protein n=1 Tax=Sphagnurus paluster TaxID=117069 RepID=A0A9P7GM27_9AGAR|nr:hypothetical protein H0H81_004752 [Sphagnurus paluster]